MITIDLHTHTSHSHGQGSVQEMFDAGRARGITVHGFSEHSPRPEGYDYPKDYRDKLTASFPRYIEEVRGLAADHAPEHTVLLGLEMDWLPGQEPFIDATIHRYDYDYVIGGIHFLGTWGFDFTPDDWRAFSPEQTADIYSRYFDALRRMGASGMFDIAAHPDIIKIFSVEAFHAWLEGGEAQRTVRDALETLHTAGMALEVSSAGLRKPCKEIYPCPAIMRMAADIGLPITFGSDAHCVNTMGFGFETLAGYARGFGYTHSVWMRRGERHERPF